MKLSRLNRFFIAVLTGFCVWFIVTSYQESLWIFNRQLSQSQINHAPPFQIKGSYFINLAASVSRKESFLKRYEESNGPLPLTRFPGFLVTDKTIKKAGDYGCMMAHCLCLREISTKEVGWYLVCEDDAHGDFGAISTSAEVRAIIALGKKYINLSAQWYYGKLHTQGHSLSKINGRTTAYLVHSSYALELSEMVLNVTPQLAIDFILMRELREPRFLSRVGNSKGAFVGLIRPPTTETSEREALNSF